MSTNEALYRSPMADVFAADAAADERASFITKTYLHLIGAIALFVGLEAALLQISGIEKLVLMMVDSPLSWLVVIGAFMVVAWVAESWARSAVSPTVQYLGLALYVLLEAVIFTPVLWLLLLKIPGGGGIVMSAALATLGLFAVLTAVVFITRKDFSWLRGLLMFGSIAAFGAVLVAVFTGFTLGPVFTYAMIALACGFILYDTSNVMQHYRTTQHVAAALALFASVALLFWYMIRLFMQLRD